MSARHDGGRNHPENLSGGLGNKYFHEADCLHLSYTTSTAPESLDFSSRKVGQLHRTRFVRRHSRRLHRDCAQHFRIPRGVNEVPLDNVDVHHAIVTLFCVECAGCAYMSRLFRSLPAVWKTLLFHRLPNFVPSYTSDLSPSHVADPRKSSSTPSMMLPTDPHNGAYGLLRSIAPWVHVMSLMAWQKTCSDHEIRLPLLHVCIGSFLHYGWYTPNRKIPS
jgi:hypothetical protein